MAEISRHQEGYIVCIGDIAGKLEIHCVDAGCYFAVCVEESNRRDMLLALMRAEGVETGVIELVRTMEQLDRTKMPDDPVTQSLIALALGDYEAAEARRVRQREQEASDLLDEARRQREIDAERDEQVGELLQAINPSVGRRGGGDASS